MTTKCALNVIVKLNKLKDRMKDKANYAYLFVDELEEAIEELENPWRPIATAPRDGTEILAYGDYAYPGDTEATNYYYITSFDNGMWSINDDQSVSYDFFRYWQPLPPPREGNE